MQLLSNFPKPLLEDIIRNKCLPIVGAGFSLNANTPAHKRMPLWDKLAETLSSELADYPPSSAIDLISAYAHEFTRSKLIERLHELLLTDVAKPGKAHVAFCNCQFDLVVTTNFDFLLERGYEKVEKYCLPIVEEDQLPIGAKDPQVTLLKLHGDLHHPTRLVATEDDYDTFLDKYPLLSTYLANLLILRTPLLIGYSLDDPDFRHIWQLVSNRLGHLRRPAYVLSVGAKSSDIARYERRGVKVINLPGSHDRYPEILEQVFSEIQRYWAEQLPNISMIVEDKPLADLSLPADATNRLCFFSVPNTLLSFYRTAIFPIALSHGLTPITVEDVISPGESVAAKVTALLSRADVVVAETSDKWVLYELSKTHSNTKVLLIDQSEMTSVDTLINWTVVQRPNDAYWESERFQSQLNDWFAKVSEELKPQLLEEPQRLLKKGENRAAVISAVALLESNLRYLFDVKQYNNVKPVSMSSMITILHKDNLITSTDFSKLRDWIQIRNKAVHQGTDVKPKVARELVNGIMDMIQRFMSTSYQIAISKDKD